ncbi:MAG: hypothetical protein JXA37_00235 [Chloroflexia bacterium]|nr:hypothetical protein [Chloroflexia bacterium]
MISLLPWWLLIQVLALLALPLTAKLLRHLPDRGYPLAKVVGVLLPSFLAWLLGMWQLASYGRALLILTVLIVAALSAVLLWRDRELLRFLRERWRLVLTYELLFALALLFGAICRIHFDPGWGGVSISHTEQPMDFAFLNGIIQSRSLPPQDPWLAGYSINYYYLGYFQAASLTLLSGIPAAITFNLNLALLLALGVTGAFSLAYNLAMADKTASRLWAAAAGALAILFVVLAGNQSGALQVIAGSSQIVALDAGELATVLRARLSGERGPIPLGHTVYTSGYFGGQFEAITPSPGHQIEDFDWWMPSRVLWDERPSLNAIHRILKSGQAGAALLRWRALVSPDEIERSYAITEFPFFSFYLADMHPHVMSIPLTLLAMALALNVLLAPERGRAALGEDRWSWFFMSLHAVVLGGLYMLNSWDLPTYLLLYGAAWVWRWRQGVEERWSRMDSKAVARDLALLVGMCLLLYLPFFLTFHSLVGGKAVPAELLDVPVLGTIARLPILGKLLQTLGPVLWDKTSLHTLFIIFGLPLYPALSWLITRRVQQAGKLTLYGAASLAICLLLAVLLHFPYLLLLIPLWLAWEQLGSSRPNEAMALLLLMLVLLLLVGCELVYLRDIFESRMNTIFKFYYQAWIMLGIVGAWACTRILQQALSGRTRWRLLWLAWAVPLLLLVVGSLCYPWLSLGQSLGEERPWTLDGLLMMQQSHAPDYEGVQWLLENTPPDAVVLEIVGPEWGYYSRISAATGRPTLLGWDGHELQWRGGQPEALAQIGIRRDVVQRIYQTTDLAEARRLLQEYEVDYVFVGTIEHNFYNNPDNAPPEARTKFAQLGQAVLDAPGVQIYRIGR